MAGYAFHPDALLEYAEATTYYLREASPEVAERFVAALESAVKSIIAAPATFWGGYCHELVFMDSAMVEARRSARLIMEAKELTGSYDEFVKTVLDSNAGGAAWREDKLLTDGARQWTRTDRQIVARYIGGGCLTLTTKAFSDALAADTQRREKKSLEGF